MSVKRGQTDSPFGYLASALKLAITKSAQYLRDSYKMIPHVGEHVLRHWGWHLDKLTRVGSLGGGSDAIRGYDER